MKKWRYFAIASLIYGMNAEAINNYDKMENRMPPRPPIERPQTIRTYLNNKKDVPNFESKLSQELKKKKIKRIKSFLNAEEKNDKNNADKLLTNAALALESLTAEKAGPNIQTNSKENKNSEQYTDNILDEIKQELTSESNSLEPQTNSSTKNATRRIVHTTENKNTTTEIKRTVKYNPKYKIFPNRKTTTDICDIFITKEQYETNDVPEWMQPYLIAYKEQHPSKQLEEGKFYRIIFKE